MSAKNSSVFIQLSRTIELSIQMIGHIVVFFRCWDGGSPLCRRGQGIGHFQLPEIGCGVALAPEPHIS